MISGFSEAFWSIGGEPKCGMKMLAWGQALRKTGISALQIQRAQS
jgi:hypothetical protein